MIRIVEDKRPDMPCISQPLDRSAARKQWSNADPFCIQPREMHTDPTSHTTDNCRTPFNNAGIGLIAPFRLATSCEQKAAVLALATDHGVIAR